VNKWERAEKIVEWRIDIIQFLKDCFPHHFNKEFSEFHREIFSILQGCKRVGIAAPRRHGKSELVSFGWVIWNLLCNVDNRFTVIISNNWANAVKYLAPIKEEIENNEMIKNVFGSLKSDKWAEDEIELKHKKKVIVGGNEFKIRGQKYLQYRPDLVIIDDAEDDELVRSEERRNNFEHWLLYGLEPALTQENNQIVMIGTILHRASQLSKMIEGEGKYTDWHTKKYQAISNACALWEEGVPLEWLENEKKKDAHKFSQEYMNNPVPFEHSAFKPNYFDDYGIKDLPEVMTINITVDLACTDKNYSDYTVILPCGVDTYGDLWILPYVRGRYIDPDEIIRHILDMCGEYKDNKREGWKLGRVGIETTAFQRFLLKPFDHERKKRGIHIPITELKAKGDKVQRISQLQPWFASGDIHIKGNMTDLKSELLDFPRGMHDDIADALAYQLSFIERKPITKKTENIRWKVTPEMQFKKALRKLALNRRPKVYTGFVGTSIGKI